MSAPDDAENLMMPRGGQMREIASFYNQRSQGPNPMGGVGPRKLIWWLKWTASQLKRQKHIH